MINASLRGYGNALKATGFFIFLLAGCGSSSSSSSATQGSTSNTTASTPSVRFIGRFDTSSVAGPKFNWSGTSIEAQFYGSSVSVQLSNTLPLDIADPAGQSIYFTVLIDGVVKIASLATAPGSAVYPLASGLIPGIHLVKIIRNNEGLFGVTQFLGFSFGSAGTLLPPAPAPGLAIEVIGDSISAGLGNTGVGPGCPFTGATENNYLAWGSVAARFFGADVWSIANQGMGLLQNSVGPVESPTNPTMVDYYLKTLNPGANLSLSSAPDFNFSSRTPPDIIVLNLGTNDFGNVLGLDPVAFRATYLSFLTMLRKNNPTSAIFCTFGVMMNTTTSNTGVALMKSVIRDLTAAGDSNLFFFDMPIQDGSVGYGCAGHPSSAEDQIMANYLIQAIKRYYY